MSDSPYLASDQWFTDYGNQNDVVISTRARLARNLANFLFPAQNRGEEEERVQVLVFDSFSQFENPDDYSAVAIKAIDEIGIALFKERGILDDDILTGLVIHKSGRTSCRINCVDHIRIADFEPGLNCEKALATCKVIDDSLQKTLQFAASYDFGYLTSSLSDVGSGMKISIRVHLPSISFFGEAAQILNKLTSKNLTVSSPFGAGDEYGVSLGSYYDITTSSSLDGSEVDQLANIESEVNAIIAYERKFRKKSAENRKTEKDNIILRAVANAKVSSLISLREAISIISAIKWGVDSGVLTGVDDSVLCGVLYRIQPSYITLLLKNGNFKFEDDIQNNSKLKIDRMRAYIIQSIFANLEFI